MIKKVFSVITILVLILACGVLSPWQYLDLSVLDVLGVEERTELATLQVSSLGGEIEIKIDGESRGVVGPEGSPFLIEDIKPGQRLVTINRLTGEEGDSENTEESSATTNSSDSNYISLERMLNFTSESNTVIAYELGPNQQFSKGQTITAFRSYTNQDSTSLNVDTTPEGTRVYLDDVLIGETPINGYDLDINRTHNLRLEKKGYEDLEMRLLPDEQEARDKLVGYDMLVEASLFLIPIEVNTINQ